VRQSDHGHIFHGWMSHHLCFNLARSHLQILFFQPGYIAACTWSDFIRRRETDLFRFVFDHFLVASDNEEVAVSVVIALISGAEPPISYFLNFRIIFWLLLFSIVELFLTSYRRLIKISSHEERRIGNYFADSAWSQFFTGVWINNLFDFISISLLEKYVFSSYLIVPSVWRTVKPDQRNRFCDLQNQTYFNQI
jgi:hypothetical protein